MHSPITLAEACRRAVDQIQASYDRLQAARELGGHPATVTTAKGAVEVVISFAGSDLPYEASCECMDDGLDLVYLDGAPHRALCPRCTHAERHKDAEGNYLATALDTLLMDTGRPAPVSSPASSYYEPEPPEREIAPEPPEDAPLSQADKQALIAYADSEFTRFS